MKSGESSRGNMKTYHFLPNKYGRELLLDIGRIEKIPNFNFGTEPHQLSFYDILFIDNGNGYFMLNDNKIALKPGTIIFTSPGQTREWHIKKPIGGYAVFFDKDFLNLFFIDELFCTASAISINTRSQPVYSLHQQNFPRIILSTHRSMQK